MLGGMDGQSYAPRCLPTVGHPEPLGTCCCRSLVCWISKRWARSMSHNTWVHQIVRPATRWLIGTRINPNHVTTVRLATALAASLLLAAAGRNWSVIAAGIFIISFLLDRADGELARQTGKSSAWGHQFDLFSDYFANIAVFLGIGFGQRGSPLGDTAVVLGILAGMAIVSIFAIVSRIERNEGLGAGAFPTAAGFDPDDAMVIVPIAICFGGEMYILIAAAIGAPIFFLWTCWRFRSNLGQLYSSTERRG